MLRSSPVPRIFLLFQAEMNYMLTLDQHEYQFPALLIKVSTFPSVDKLWMGVREDGIDIILHCFDSTIRVITWKTLKNIA
jgi:hypothetical protein